VGRLRRAAAAGLALALGAAACGPGRDPSLRYQAFVPVVLSSRLPKRIPWQTRVEVTNPGGSPAVVRLHRWPPDARDAEIEEYAVAPRTTRGIPLRIPLFPSVSSFLFESRGPFTVRAVVRDRRGGGLALEVPVLDPGQLAQPGDTLRVGPLLRDGEHRSHICYTFPGSERDAVPFRVRSVVVSAEGTPLGTFEHPVHGVPEVIEDPWTRFSLHERRPIFVEVTLLGGTRGRSPVWGLWVYGIVTEKATNVSRFVPTTVTRGRRASGSGAG